jgi:uncharacterized membrane protein
MSVLIMVWMRRYFGLATELGWALIEMVLGRGVRLTEMNVPGRKNRVTRVIIFMETVSCCVFIAISNIASVIFSMRSVESWARLA